MPCTQKSPGAVTPATRTFPTRKIAYFHQPEPNLYAHSPSLLAACAFSCARPRQPAYGPYRNLDRGYLTEGKIRQPLHGRPKQITEYILSRPDTAGPQARHGFFIR